MLIYQIKNKKNGKSYVGATEGDFKFRYPGNRWWKHTHSNQLKYAVEKYGLESFEVIPLWEGEVLREELYRLEIEYIKQHNSMVPNGYNMTHGGKSSKESTTVKKFEIIDHTGQVFKGQNISKFCRKMKLSSSAMINMLNGLSKFSQGYALLGTDPKTIKNPSEIIIFVEIKTKLVVEIPKNEIKNWANEVGLSSGDIRKLIGKRSNNIKGWKLFNSVDSNVNKYKNITLVSPDGELVVVKNIYSLAKETGVNRWGLNKLARGDLFSYKGWKRYGITKAQYLESRPLREGISVNLISPEGEKVTVNNVASFCRKMNFKYKAFFAVIEKRAKFHKGWTLYND